MSSPLKATEEEVKLMRSRLMDRSWAVIAFMPTPKDESEPVGSTRGGVLFKEAKSFKGLADRCYPCFIMGDNRFVQGLFLENPNEAQVTKFCAITCSNQFANNRGYVFNDPDAPNQLDWSKLVIGSVQDEEFTENYFIVVTQYEEKAVGNSVVAVLAKQMVAFKVPGVADEDYPNMGSDDDDDDDDDDDE